MHDEKLIDDLFEAARTEDSVRSFASVEQFVQTSAGTNTSLLVQWLKQYKMNILITTSGIAITAAIFLFPQQEPTKQNVISNIQETDKNEIVLEQESTKEPSKTVYDSVLDSQVTPEKEKSSDTVAQVITQKDNESNSSISVTQKSTPRSTQLVQTKQLSSSKIEITEHRVILESSKGKNSVTQFSEYLTNNLKQLDHEFTSSSSKNEIKKFTLKLDNRYEVDFRMQVAGFATLELFWDETSEGELQNMRYRIDSTEFKELDFSKSKKSSVRVKHRHQEF